MLAYCHTLTDDHTMTRTQTATLADRIREFMFVPTTALIHMARRAGSLSEKVRIDMELRRRSTDSKRSERNGRGSCRWDQYAILDYPAAINFSPEAAEQRRAALPAIVAVALLSPNLSHTRARNHCGASVCIYHRDDTSPTGVMLATMCDEVMFDRVFAELRAAGLVAGYASPLSPTEAR